MRLTRVSVFEQPTDWPFSRVRNFVCVPVRGSKVCRRLLGTRERCIEREARGEPVRPLFYHSCSPSLSRFGLSLFLKWFLFILVSWREGSFCLSRYSFLSCRIVIVIVIALAHTRCFDCVCIRANLSRTMTRPCILSLKRISLSWIPGNEWRERVEIKKRIKGFFKSIGI